MHEIRQIPFSTRKAKTTIQKECDAIAKRDGEYHHALDRNIRFYDIVCKDYEEAYKFLEAHDRGWYDALAVKFKEGRSIKWLVQFEYHV